jgi:cytochrome b
MRRSFTRVKVWDAPTRLFHWLLVGAMLLSWWSERTDRIRWHEFCGYAVGALISFRIFWGFFGSETSRFGDFVTSPRRALHYARSGAWKQVGHNPLGGYSVLAMLATLLAQVVLGLFSMDRDGLDSGPLAYLISPRAAHLATLLHGLVFEALLALILFHVGAVSLYAARGRNLVGPMIDGMAPIPIGAQAPRMASRKTLFLGVMLGLAVIVALLSIGG